MAYRDVLYLRNILYLTGGMMEPKRFDSDVSFNCVYADDGNLVRADEHLAAIAERDTTIEQLRAAIREAVEQITVLDVRYHYEVTMRSKCLDIVAGILEEKP